MNDALRSTGSSAAFSAAVMLLVGFYFGRTGISDSALYNTAVAATTWSMRLGGLGMVVVALLCYSGQRLGLLLDAVVGLGAGGLIAAASLLCILMDLGRGKSLDVNDLIFTIVGFGTAAAARGSWALYRGSDPGTPSSSAPRAGSRGAPPAPPAAEPVHPASIRPASLQGDAPPPQGYLAALAREDESPDRADHE